MASVHSCESWVRRAARPVPAAGFEGIELWWPFPTSTPDPADVDALVAAITDAGVRLTGLNFHAGDMPGGDRGLDPHRLQHMARLALPDEQALPALTAMPARSSWTSIAMLVAPGSAIAPIAGIRGDSSAITTPSAAFTPCSSLERSRAIFSMS